MEITNEVYFAAGDLMRRKGQLGGVADEGGWWPNFSSNEEALEVLARRSALPAKSRASGS